MKATATEGPALAVAFALLAAACAWPVLAVQYVPLVDLPSHAAQVALWRAYADHPELQERYLLQLTSPYVGFYFVWRGLTALGLSIENAGRLMTIACLIGIPAGLMSLLAARGRPRAWALLAFPFVFSWSFAWGFLPFCFAVVTLFPALAAFAHWLRTGRRGAGFAAAILGLVVLWMHGLVVAFWGAACLLLASVEWSPSAPSWKVRLLPLFPTGGLLAAWTFSSFGAHSPTSFSGTTAQRLGSFFSFVYGGSTELVTTVAGLGRFVVLGAVGCAVWSAMRAAPRRFASGFDVGALALAGLALALYLFGPFEFLQAEMVNVRFASLACIFFIAALPFVASERARAAILGSAALVSILVDVSVWTAWRGFNEDIGDARALFASLPSGTSVARPEGAPRNLPPFELRVLDNIGGWHQVYGFGPTKASTRLPQMLVRDRIPTDESPEATLVRQNGALAVAVQGMPPDVLVFYSRDPIPESLPVVGGGERYRLVGRSGGLDAYVLSDGNVPDRQQK